MATCTPIYGLAMVECSDRPCDIDDTMCQFANDVEVELDRLDAIVTRTATTIPQAVVAFTESTTYTVVPASNFPTVFDTVLADTDDMFDSAVPEQILINTPGMYSLSANIWGKTTGAGGNLAGTNLYFRVQTGPTPVTITSDVRQFAANGLNFFLDINAAHPLLAGDVVILLQSVFFIVPDTFTVNRVQFSVTWLGDLS